MADRPLDLVPAAVHAEPEAASTPTETYGVDAVCFNCDHQQVAQIPKGTPAPRDQDLPVACEQCGCHTLRRVISSPPAAPRATVAQPQPARSHGRTDWPAGWPTSQPDWAARYLLDMTAPTTTPADRVAAEAARQQQRQMEEDMRAELARALLTQSPPAANRPDPEQPFRLGTPVAREPATALPADFAAMYHGMRDALRRQPNRNGDVLPAVTTTVHTNHPQEPPAAGLYVAHDSSASQALSFWQVELPKATTATPAAKDS